MSKKKIPNFFEVHEAIFTQNFVAGGYDVSIFGTAKPHSNTEEGFALSEEELRWGGWCPNYAAVLEIFTKLNIA